MVLINAGKRRTLTRRERRGTYNTEMIIFCLFVLCCIGFTIYNLQKFIVLTPDHKIKISKRDQQSFFAKHRHVIDEDHPELNLNNNIRGENYDFFDSVASDILETIQCHTLLKNHNPIMKNDILIYGSIEYADDSNNNGFDRIRYHRRLDDSAEEEEGQQLFHEESTDDLTEGQQQQQQHNNNMEQEDMKLDMQGWEGPVDDDFQPVQDNNSRIPISAAHLFCLSALPKNSDNDELKFWDDDKVNCQVRDDKQQDILDLWSTARAEIPDEKLLLQIIHSAVEQEINLVGTELKSIWAPPHDDGTEFMVNELNLQRDKQEEGEYGGFAGLQENLGINKLYVDVGSGLGYTAMAVAILYPGTEIVTYEAAQTNWLLQNMNWICNNFIGEALDTPPKVILGGVGPSHTTSQMAKFVWRPTATTNTRAWSLSMEDEYKDEDKLKSKNDIELSVKLKPWHHLLSEGDIKNRNIDVLNIDCEGCEYNLIPSLSTDEYNTISTIMGQLHWGYIPKLKLPSSKRGKDTHERLCEHENFARISIECCAFPNIPVHSTISGEILVIDEDDNNNKKHHSKTFERQVTIKDLAGDLCDKFDTWADEHNLYTVESDWSWFQVSSLKQTTNSHNSADNDNNNNNQQEKRRLN